MQAAVDSLNTISLSVQQRGADAHPYQQPSHVLGIASPYGQRGMHIWIEFMDVATVDLDTGLYTLKPAVVRVAGISMDEVHAQSAPE